MPASRLSPAEMPSRAVLPPRSARRQMSAGPPGWTRNPGSGPAAQAAGYADDVKQHQLNLLALGAVGRAAREYRVQPAPGHGHGPGVLTIAPPLRDSGYELLTRPGYPADSLLTSAAVSAALA